MNAAIRRGAKYFAVDTTPSFRLPARTPLIASIWSSSSAQPLLDRLGGVDHREACGSRTHAVRRAVEQGEAELVLELPQLDRHRRRSQALTPWQH